MSRPTYQLGEFVWRSTHVRWEPRGVDTVQLVRTTTEEFEIVGSVAPIGRLQKRALSPEDISELWACSRCHRVTRNARNSMAPAEPLVWHYLDCERAPWRRDWKMSRAYGFDVEVCDGVVARNWRCATCRQRYSEDEAIRCAENPAVRLPWRLHRRSCAHRSIRLSTRSKTQALAMRNREALGQATLFEPVDLEVIDAT